MLRLCHSLEGYKISEQQIQVDIATAPGNLTVVAVALEYYKGAILPTNKNKELRWLPAGVGEGFYN